MNKSFQHQLQTELSELTTKREAAELQSVAKMLTDLPAVKRSPATHENSWKLLAARTSEKTKPKRWKMFAFAAAPALMLAVLVTSITSMSAVPGDATYSVKRTIENAQIALAFSSSKKAEACSQQMKRRANELARLSTDKLSTTVVADLTKAIITEAEEFTEYANTSGADRARLQKQQSRDASYVIDALDAAADHAVDPAQLKLIRSTQATMQTLVDQAA